MTGSQESALERSPDDRADSTNTSDSKKTVHHDKKLDSGIVLFTTFIVVGICQGCFFIYISLLPYLSRNYGIDPVTFGYIQTSAGFVQFAISPFIGRFGDQFGSRAVLILNAACSAMCHLILGLATGVSGIVLSRAVAIGQDIRLGSHMMVSDLVTGEARGAAVAKLAIPMSLGLLIGPATGGFLAKFLSPQQSLLVTWMAPLFCMIIMFIYVPSDTRRDPVPRDGASKKVDKSPIISLLKQRSVALLMIMRALVDLPFVLVAMNLTLFVMTEFKLSPQMNGLLLSYNGALALIINILITRWLAKKYTNDQLLQFAPWIMTVSYLSLGFANTMWMLSAALVPFNLGYAILESQTVARISDVAPPGQTGSLMGIQSSILQFARIVAPLLGGYLLQNVGFRSIGFCGAFASFALGLVVLTASTKRDKEKTL